MIIVLNYHDIHTGDDPYVHSISAEMFRKQISYLQKHFEIIPLVEVCKQLRDNQAGLRNRRIAAITFDDAFAGACEYGVSLLQKNRYHPLSLFRLKKSDRIYQPAIKTDRWQSCLHCRN